MGPFLERDFSSQRDYTLRGLHCPARHRSPSAATGSGSERPKLREEPRRALRLRDVLMAKRLMVSNEQFNKLRELPKEFAAKGGSSQAFNFRAGVGSPKGAHARI